MYDNILFIFYVAQSCKVFQNFNKCSWNIYIYMNIHLGVHKMRAVILLLRVSIVPWSAPHNHDIRARFAEVGGAQTKAKIVLALSIFYKSTNAQTLLKNFYSC